MIVRLLRTVLGGQEETGRVIFEDGELRVEAKRPDQLLNTIFQGPTPEDPGAIAAALLDMPRRFDGIYLRAQIIGMEEGGPGSGWFSPPRGTHGSGSQGGPVIHAPGQPTLPTLTPPHVEEEGISPFEQSIIDGDVVDNGEHLQGGVTSPLVVEVDGEPAIFKEHQGDMMQRHDGFSEVAAKEIADLLSRDVLEPGEVLVEEVVMTEYAYTFGTIHKWVDGTPGEFTHPDRRVAITQDPDNRARLEVFVALDIIINNADRHEMNWVVGDDGKLWAIDHGHAQWTERDRGSDFFWYASGPIWQPHYQGLSLPGYRSTDRKGRNTLTYKFDGHTRHTWSTITRDEFDGALEMVTSEISWRGGGSRVDADVAWKNFQRLIEYGEVVQDSQSW